MCLHVLSLSYYVLGTKESIIELGVQRWPKHRRNGPFPLLSFSPCWAILYTFVPCGYSATHFPSVLVSSHMSWALELRFPLLFRDEVPQSFLDAL